MSEYMNKIDVYNVLTKYYHHHTDEQHKALKDALSRVPTADVIHVVQCKDCNYKESCCRNIITDPDWSIQEQIDYCSYGKIEEQDHE